MDSEQSQCISNETWSSYEINKTAIQNITKQNESVPENAPKVDTSQNLLQKIHKRPQRISNVIHNFKNEIYPLNPQTLLRILWPTLKILLIQNPESMPFLDMRNKQKKCRKIKKLMDFLTIQNKLCSGQYEDGWKYVDDVWIIFKNAFLYYKKNSSVYKNAQKLAKLFNDCIDEPMQKFGYCCGQNFEFEPKLLSCYNPPNCFIQKYATYWSYEERYLFCRKCFSSIKGDVIVSNSEGTLRLQKNQFVEKKNSSKSEQFVLCMKCNRKFHKICCLYFEEIWKGFICCHCLRTMNKIKNIPDQFSSQNFQQTKLGSHVEKRVNSFLQNQKCDSKVIIRVVYTDKKEVEVKPGVRAKFVDTGIWPERFPHNAKTLLAFQKIENYDVCFFALFVQEYDSECPQPNRRRVYISYLDSVCFFQPQHLRTYVYHEILLGYMDYVKSLGYLTVHLWSCPSSEGEDYIFYGHPKEQRILSVEKLQEWYKSLLDKGIKYGIVKSYQDIYKQAIEDNIKNISELPYFDGDFFPTSIETQILKLETKAEKLSKNSIERMKILEENQFFKTVDAENIIKRKKIGKNNKSFKKLTYLSTDDPLTDRIISLIAMYKKEFIIIHLCTSEILSKAVIIDPDPLISSSIMNTRESFLCLCKESDCDFSSLRRAKYSTLLLLYELHKETLVTISCNICKNILQTGFYCLICKDFDLCCDCFNCKGHVHKMEKLNISFQIYSLYSEIPKISKAHLDAVNHLSFCMDGNCSAKVCKIIRHYEDHTKAHRKKEGCEKCRTYTILVAKHFKYCQNNNCWLFLCKLIKQRKMPRLQKIRMEHCTLSSKDQSFHSNVKAYYNVPICSKLASQKLSNCDKVLTGDDLTKSLPLYTTTPAVLNKYVILHLKNENTYQTSERSYVSTSEDSQLLKNNMQKIKSSKTQICHNPQQAIKTVQDSIIGFDQINISTGLNTNHSTSSIKVENKSKATGLTKTNNINCANSRVFNNVFSNSVPFSEQNIMNFSLRACTPSSSQNYSSSPLINHNAWFQCNQSSSQHICNSIKSTNRTSTIKNIENIKSFVPTAVSDVSFKNNKNEQNVALYYVPLTTANFDSQKSKMHPVESNFISNVNLNYSCKLNRILPVPLKESRTSSELSHTLNDLSNCNKIGVNYNSTHFEQSLLHIDESIGNHRSNISSVATMRDSFSTQFNVSSISDTNSYYTLSSTSNFELEKSKMCQMWSDPASRSNMNYTDFCVPNGISQMHLSGSQISSASSHISNNSTCNIKFEDNYNSIIHSEQNPFHINERKH